MSSDRLVCDAQAVTVQTATPHRRALRLADAEESSRSQARLIDARSGIPILALTSETDCV